VQQRGIAATQEILTALLDGVESDNGKGQQAKVHILDILPNRYNEWGRACLQFQKERLRTGNGREFFFSAYCTGDEK
ncbi:Uncharacterized protein SCF082_LOCUS38473, partial [Durusdinium trenchii]